MVTADSNQGTAQRPSNATGVVGLVMGVIGVALIPFPARGLLPGIVATACSATGLSQVRSGKATNRGMCRAGLALGVLATAEPIATYLVLAYLFLVA